MREHISEDIGLSDGSIVLDYIIIANYLDGEDSSDLITAISVSEDTAIQSAFGMLGMAQVSMNEIFQERYPDDGEGEEDDVDNG